MDLKIREAIPEDASAILAVFNPIIEAGIYTAFDTPISVEDERTYLEELGSRAIFQVAVLAPERAILGFQSMEPFASYTGAFDHVGVVGTYVALGMRRRGVSKRLFEALFDKARAKGYEKILTYIRADNPAALASYEHQGFRIVGRAERHAKLRGRYVDEIIVERFL